MCFSSKKNNKNSSPQAHTTQEFVVSFPTVCVYSVQSIHIKMGPGSGELPYLAIFRDFIVHSAVLQNLKLEKRSKKGYLNWGSNHTAQRTVAGGVKRPGI